MKEEEIIRSLLSTSMRLRADDVTIRLSENRTCKARGSIWRDEKKKCFVLHLTILEGGPIDLVGSGIFRIEQFWPIEGRIEDLVNFRCVSLPSSTTSHAGNPSVEWVDFCPDKLALKPLLSVNWAAERKVDRRRNHENLAKQYPSIFSDSWNEDKWSDQERWSAVIIIPKAKLIHKNQGTLIEETNPLAGKTSREFSSTLAGEWKGRKFGVIQKDEACEVMLSEEGESRSSTFENFENEVNSLLCGLAFVNGWEPWSQRRTIKLGLDVVWDEVAPVSTAPNSKFTPLSEGLCHYGADPIALIGAAWDFFRNDPDAKEISHALHLFRQATRREVPVEIGLLAQCTLFEGVLDILYKRLNAVQPLDQISAFEDAKNKMLCFLKENCRPSNLAGDPAQDLSAIAWTRFRNIISSARFLRPEDRFRSLCRHYKLSEEAFFKPVLQKWNKYRHPLAHGRSGDCDGVELMLASSRLAGAQYILLAKLFGYSGRIFLSQIEDQPTAI